MNLSFHREPALFVCSRRLRFFMVFCLVRTAFSSPGNCRAAASFVASRRWFLATAPSHDFGSKRSSMSTSDDEVYISVADALKLYQDESKKITFLDGSWYLPAPTKGREDFEAGPRILGAQFLDIDQVAAAKGSADNPKSLPHMIPPPALWARVMDAMGISNQHDLIVYSPEAACPFIHRAWFQCRALHSEGSVRLLNGSVNDWKEAGGPVDGQPTKAINVDNLPPTDGTTQYRAKASVSEFVDIERVLEIINSNSDNTLLLDARPPGRFTGEAPEPRPGLKSGHMPGAKNVFSQSLVDPDSPSKLKPKSELLKVFQQAGIDNPSDPSTKIVATCGSGVTACTVAAALITCGRDPATISVYDGSWSEYGGEENVPLVTGTEEP